MKISIENLTFKCIIGILDFERVKKQKVIIDIFFNYDYINNDTFIDYSEISSKVEKIMKKEKFELLEEAILYIEKFLSENYPIKNLKIKISKPNILKNCIVSLEN
ncbi:dihydroneopterin aldolase [Halarcobacter bivalviorum]|uniref:dihydroneopterin aldolase n=1 Tax=Halarcobacter bivalviorum TaxID=663364 RepID=A0AAX2A8A2_9BACT|nr:dihydroneopterin aldolase [Halarcobacter bivalviorum]AXH13208.1 dihydroneopterin aldolase [Halarcobacter bivalviorum]RXK10185.1 dihydroneopterin aldolase [Halarcobacter bivalviorum]